MRGANILVEMALKPAFNNRPGARNVIVMQDTYHDWSLATMAASWPHLNNPFHALQPPCFTSVQHPDSYRQCFGMDLRRKPRFG